MGVPRPKRSRVSAALAAYPFAAAARAHSSRGNLTRNHLSLLAAIVLVAVLHKGMHAGVAIAYGEFQAFRIRPLGLEVVYSTPAPERHDSQWALIAGASSVATLALGYALFVIRRDAARFRSPFLRAAFYWLTMLGLLVDPLNLSIGAFVYGGGANGIAFGLGVSRYWVQAVSGAVLLANRELVVQKLLPAYGVTTRHPLFVPWLRRPPITT